MQVPPTSEARYGVRLVLAYDGTDFCGFQFQPSERTVQGELERAIERMDGGLVGRVRGAGRTDSGVHALGQVAAFVATREISDRGWQLGLNTNLPDDLRVLSARACEPGWDPRFASRGKLYRYVIELGERQNPLLRRHAWHVGKQAKKLDLAAMRRAARALEGTHDYRAFRAADDERENTVRTLWSIDLHEHYLGDPTLLAIEVRGTAFMKNMVRIITGTLVDVGRGKLAPEAMNALLSEHATRDMAGQTAPAHGLTLVEVMLEEG